MNISVALFASLFSFVSGFAVPTFLQQATDIAVRWDWLVVSTPDFYGDFRGNAPGFKPPVPKQPLPITLRLAEEKTPHGMFEALVSTEGVTMPEQTLAVSSPETERLVNEILRQWRFETATLEGKPIRVRLRVSLFTK